MPESAGAHKSAVGRGSVSQLAPLRGRGAVPSQSTSLLPRTGLTDVTHVGVQGSPLKALISFHKDFNTITHIKTPKK